LNEGFGLEEGYALLLHHSSFIFAIFDVSFPLQRGLSIFF